MANASASLSSVQVAAVVFPLLALIIGFTIDSVRDEDSLGYRIVVAGLGVGAFAPAASFFYIALAAPQAGVDSGVLMKNIVLATILIFLLTLSVLLKESSRGLENREKAKLFGAVFVFLVIVGWVMINI